MRDKVRIRMGESDMKSRAKIVAMRIGESDDDKGLGWQGGRERETERHFSIVAVAFLFIYNCKQFVTVFFCHLYDDVIYRLSNCRLGSETSLRRTWFHCKCSEPR